MRAAPARRTAILWQPCVFDCSLAVDDSEDVFFADDEVVFAFDLDLGAGVLRVDDAVAGFQIHLDDFTLVGLAAGADREDDAFLRLLFRRVGKDDAACGRRRLLDALDDDAIAERFDIDFRRGWHGYRPSLDDGDDAVDAGGAGDAAKRTLLHRKCAPVWGVLHVSSLGT